MSDHEKQPTTSRRDFVKTAGTGVAAAGVLAAAGIHARPARAADGEKATYDADVDPAATYERKVGPDLDFYNKVIATKTNGTRKLVYEGTNDAHMGDAFFLKAGQVIRFEQRPSKHNGRTQIADVMFVTPDLSQISDHLNTSAFEGLNQRLYSGVWTQSLFCEKIATMVADEFPYEKLEHEDVSHVFFAAHCCAEWITMVHGPEDNVNSCHENFIHAFNRLPAVRAIKDETERRRVVQALADRNDINIFQGNLFTQDDRHVTRCRLSPTPSVDDGVGIEWYAEKDMYAIVSNCPYADQALPFPEAKPNPLYVSVWETGIKPYSQDHLGNRKHAWEDNYYRRIATKDTSVVHPPS